MHLFCVDVNINSFIKPEVNLKFNVNSFIKPEVNKTLIED